MGSDQIARVLESGREGFVPPCCSSNVRGAGRARRPSSPAAANRISRAPARPDAASDADWADYLFMRSNPKGRFRERWHHSAGCRRWFNVERDTATNVIAAVYRMDEIPSEG